MHNATNPVEELKLYKERKLIMNGSTEEKKRELVCIRCPIGCMLTVTQNEEGALTVTGNTCPRGGEYAKKELTNPARTVTTTVRVRGGRHKVVSVKTGEDIPKGKIMECMEALKGIEIEAPVHIGDIIIKDIEGTGVDIVATKAV